LSRGELVGEVSISKAVNKEQHVRMTRSIRRKRDRIHCPDAGAGSDIDNILKNSNQLGFPIYET
jgi:hypothetical protein